MMMRIVGLFVIVLMGGDCFAREVRDGDTGKILHSIGMVACLKHKKDAPALAKYETLKPDLMLWMGDNVYADTVDMKKMREHYAILAKRDDFQELSKYPTMATWDDHDFGWNNSGAAYAKREESKQIFMDFWKMGKSKAVREQPGVYSARIFGPKGKRVQVIMLDGRYAKTNEVMMAEQQWKWLSEQLDKPAEWRFIVSGQQVLLSKNTLYEAWSKSGQEQKRLLALIREKKASGVVLLSGDQHYVEVSKMEKALGYDAWEFTFAGVNQDEPESLNDHRVGKVLHVKHKYAGLDLQWGESPKVAFRVFDVNGNKLHETVLKLADLQVTDD